MASSSANRPPERSFASGERELDRGALHVLAPRGSFASGVNPVQAELRAEEAEEPRTPVTASFREIYDNYFGFVWRNAANRGVPRSALDDVTQEVFIVISRKLPEFEGRSSLTVWIAGIVRRVVADYLKKRGNRSAGDEPLEREPAAEPESAEHLERKAALELLDSLLAKMTDEQRDVFVMCELEGMSGSEIAAVTGINENTVWTRVRAARRIFQEGVTRQRARLLRQE